MPIAQQIPPLHGLGLRSDHYADILGEDAAPLDFVEVISENFMIDGGRPRDILDRVRERHPVALHGVSMSVGSADGLDPDYLRRLKRLADHVDPLFVSDHLCWTRTAGFSSHDLLPLPYTEEALDIVCANIARAQDVLERPLLIENPSTYLRFADADYGEANFIAEMCARTGCNLLLDVNNVFVNAHNHGFDPLHWLDAIPLDQVRQIHLAGHSAGRDGLLIDTHDAPVPDPVWALYRAVLQRIGPVATMIERDAEIPPFADLLAELAIARAMGLPGLSAAA